MLAGSRSTPPFAPRGKCPRARAWHRRTRAPLGTASIAPAATHPLAGCAPAPMSDPTLGAVGIVPAPDDVQAAAPRALAWLARRLSRDERIPGPPGKLAPFARRQRERAYSILLFIRASSPSLSWSKRRRAGSPDAYIRTCLTANPEHLNRWALGTLRCKAALPYRAPAYFLSSSPRGKAPRITPSFPGAGTGRARGSCRRIGWRTWGSGAGSPGT